MSTCPLCATVTISIDLEGDPARAAHLPRHALEIITDRLLVLLAQLQMPATWAVADPAVSAARGRIAAARGGHELAILGDASWVGREAGRSRFARELARRTAGARDAGVPIATLAVKSLLPLDHCDLAIKEGITAVRHTSESPQSRAPGRLQARTLRFGLWAFPVSILLPGTSRWLPGGGGARAARLLIDDAVGAQGIVQLAIDAPRLAARGSAAARVLARVLDHVQRRRRHGLLEIVTLGAIARQLAGEHRGAPSRSILRPAA
jgi:hypothetical protein